MTTNKHCEDKPFINHTTTRDIQERSSSRIINIAYIVPEMNSGGVEQNVLEVANYLSSVQEEIFNIYIITSGIKLERFLNKNINIIKLNVKTKNPIKIIKNCILLKNIFKEKNIQIVHVKSRAPAVSVWLLKKFNLFSFQFISTIHGLYNCNNYFKYKYANIITRADKVIAVSPATFDYVLNEHNMAIDRVELINRGIDLSQYSNKKITVSSLFKTAKYINLDEDCRKMLLFPARISPNKGHLILLEALRTLNRDDYCCMLLSSNIKNKKLKNEIISKINEYGLQDKITLIENIENIKIAYFLSYFVISLSMKEESFGRIPLEAGAMFRPTIASNIGNYRKTVINGKTGFLVEPFNHIDIADKINQALNLSTKEWESFCINNNAYIRKYYQIEQMFENTKNIYNNILKTSLER